MSAYRCGVATSRQALVQRHKALRSDLRLICIIHLSVYDTSNGCSLHEEACRHGSYTLHQFPSSSQGFFEFWCTTLYVAGGIESRRGPRCIAVKHLRSLVFATSYPPASRSSLVVLGLPCYAVNASWRVEKMAGEATVSLIYAQFNLPRYTVLHTLVTRVFTCSRGKYGPWYVGGTHLKGHFD